MPPDDICGYQPELPEDWTGKSPVDGVTFAGEYCCTRPTHNGADRCIWHSRRRRKRLTDSTLDQQPNYVEASSNHVDDESPLSNHSRILSAERIDDAYLHGADVRIDFEDVYFYNCRLPEASFYDNHIELVSFQHCLLDDTEFLNCRVGATFDQSSVCLAEFRESEFTGAKLTDSSLIGVRFYECDFKASTFESPEFSREVLFSGCSIDHATSFDDIRIQNSGAYEYEAKMKVYGQLADLCLSSREVNKYVKYKKRERYAEGHKQLHDLKDADEFHHDFVSSLVNYLSHEYSRITMGYGYSVGRVLVTMAIALLFGTFAYAGLECGFDQLVGVNHGCHTVAAVLHTGLDAFYFSVMSFTTTGYGDISPTGFARFIAILQTFAGLILGAQFVYVLSTKTSL